MEAVVICFQIHAAIFCCRANRFGAACAPVMTSGNGSTNSSQHSGESKTAQQAIDTSHILTHLIEGFVIQEGAEPFPVERPSFSIDSLRRRAADSKMDGLSSKGKSLSLSFHF
ncbi:hypothetical protein GOODEAATRI_020575 [Goodea atripinnis]|uniref:Uncharacterized protein n=1 Tax=Goodea atripinnis TaxID=208336 RepID=A0ABV0NLX6_9TELE